MGDLSVTVLAAEGGGQKNFLIPNGTFFVVLLIFLIVLGVIGKFVVPPITKVLHERDEMVAKTVAEQPGSGQAVRRCRSRLPGGDGPCPSRGVRGSVTRHAPTAARFSTR